MKKSAHRCQYCKFARFHFTQAGHISTAKHGECSFEVPIPKVPDCVESPRFSKKAIWPDEGTHCPCFESHNEPPEFVVELRNLEGRVEVTVDDRNYLIDVTRNSIELRGKTAVDLVEKVRCGLFEAKI